MEAVADLPASVGTLRDYGELLATFHAAHAQIEGALGAPEWDRGWHELGLDITGHGQLQLLSDDLACLGRQPGSPDHATDHHASDQSTLNLTSQAQALGCLYVVEGSAIGRRMLAPLLKQQLGVIPTAFFNGAGGHPQAWRGVQRALATVAGDPERQRDVVEGARAAFGVFLDALGRRARRARRRSLSSA